MKILLENLQDLIKFQLKNILFYFIKLYYIIPLPSLGVDRKGSMLGSSRAFPTG